MASLSFLSQRRWLLLSLCAALASGCSDDDDEGPAAGGTAGNAGTGGSSTGIAADCGVAANPGVPPLVLTEVASGLERPIYLTQPAGDDRLFIVEKPGRIRIVSDGVLVDQPFLTVAGVSERGGEMGLLGLAFHPDYADNGRFYVYYSTLQGGTAHISRVAEYRVSAVDPDLADATTERVLFEVSQPQDNHNGGDLQFGSDGFLYIGLGDGGGGGDGHGPIGNGQDLGTRLGKILRIDVDGTGGGENGNYAVPSGNIATAGALPEIWSYGLRNPWRYSFDACTGDMYIGDVGQNAIEEVNFEPAGVSGRNYGWRLMEGATCYNPNTGCDAAAQNLVLPVASYDHDIGQSITGGYVYLGASLPDLRGTYLYADYQSARFFSLRLSNGALAAEPVEITDNINPGQDVGGIASFGQDATGELYVVSYDGAVYRIEAE